MTEFLHRGRRLVTRIAVAAIGLAASVGGMAQGQVAPSAAPAAWVRYTEAATGTVSAWLGEEGEAASRFRTYFHQTRRDETLATPSLEIKLWISADGTVERIAFAPFVHQQANDDLTAAITRRKLGPPPRGILLPLRVAIEMDPDTAVSSS